MLEHAAETQMCAQLPLQHTLLPCAWHDAPRSRHPQYDVPPSPWTQFPLQQSLADVQGPNAEAGPVGVQAHFPLTQLFEQHCVSELHVLPAGAQAQWPPVQRWLQHAPSFEQPAPSASQMHVP